MDCDNLEFNFLKCMKKMGQANDKCKNEFESWFNCYKIDLTTCCAVSNAPSTHPCFVEKASPQIYIPSKLDRVFITL